MKKIVILGSGGHSKVVKDLLLCRGHSDFVIFERDDEDEFLRTANPDDYEMALGIGMPTEDPIAGLVRRIEVAAKFTRRGFVFPPLVHPSAIVSRSCWIAEGAQVMAGSVLQPWCVIGNFAIVNTRASIDHDCLLKEGSHVAPGATLGGSVEVGYNSLIGIGATVRQSIRIGDRALVGGGSMVVKNVANGERVLGVPACTQPTKYWKLGRRSAFSEPMPEHGLP